MFITQPLSSRPIGVTTGSRLHSSEKVPGNGHGITWIGQVATPGLSTCAEVREDVKLYKIAKD